MKFVMKLNEEDCDFCNECVESCTGDALRIMVEFIDGVEFKYLDFTSEDCTNCEVCSDICPTGAISIEIR